MTSLLVIFVCLFISSTFAHDGHHSSIEHVTFKAEDISEITLYGSSAVYRPDKCPKSITFTARARVLPQLTKGKIGIYPNEMEMDGEICSADVDVIDFAPIGGGSVSHIPPQWAFEDSTFAGHPVNFTCGLKSYSIRFGYFNDVDAKMNNGFLDPTVVYLDFAIIPNTVPFGFCSFATRREDGGRPIDFAPFPTNETWRSVYDLRRGTTISPENQATEEVAVESPIATFEPVTPTPSDFDIPIPMKEPDDEPQISTSPSLRQFKVADPYPEAQPLRINVNQ